MGTIFAVLAFGVVSMALKVWASVLNSNWRHQLHEKEKQRRDAGGGSSGAASPASRYHVYTVPGVAPGASSAAAGPSAAGGGAAGGPLAEATACCAEGRAAGPVAEAVLVEGRVLRPGGGGGSLPGAVNGSTGGAAAPAGPAYLAVWSSQPGAPLASASGGVAVGESEGGAGNGAPLVVLPVADKGGAVGYDAGRQDAERREEAEEAEEWEWAWLLPSREQIWHNVARALLLAFSTCLDYFNMLVRASVSFWGGVWGLSTGRAGAKQGSCATARLLWVIDQSCIMTSLTMRRALLVPRSCAPQVAMTFNVGLFVAVVLGYALGALLFSHITENLGRRHSRQRRRREERCCGPAERGGGARRSPSSTSVDSFKAMEEGHAGPCQH